MAYKFTSLGQLKDMIRNARNLQDVKAKARADGFTVVKSRGVFMQGHDAKGNHVIAEPVEFNQPLRLKDIYEVAENAIKDGAVVVDLYGGYDVSETLQHWCDRDYEPWYAEWSVTIWEKN